MFDPYSTLGIQSSATKDEARAAYRRLASKYHPDKVPLNEQAAATEKFKQIKGAWEMIDNGFELPKPTPQPTYPQYRSSFTSPQDPPHKWAHTESSFIRKPSSKPAKKPHVPIIVQAHIAEPRKNLGEFIARPSMAEAFNGFILEVQLNGQKVQVKMPRGVPHGLRNTVQVGDDDITVTTLFTQNVYQFVGLDRAIKEGVIVNSAPGVVYRTKDLYLRHEVTETSLQRTRTVKLLDFLGEPFDLKIPAGHSPRDLIRVPGRGYVDWYSSHSQAGDVRGDVLVQLIPTEEVPMSHLL